MSKKLILASTSIYRQELLKQLCVPFEAKKPLFDEEQYKIQNLAPKELAETLATLKAESLKDTNCVIIGGDQLVHLEGQIIGKPHTHENAVATLEKMSGKLHELITSVCVIDRDQKWLHTDITKIKLKPLTSEQIRRYVDLDKPFDCAGSYKIEKHGISLVDQIICDDFTAIQGLPLIALSNILHNCGYQIP